MCSWNYSSEYTFSDTAEFESFTAGDYARIITEPSAVYDRSDTSHAEEVSLRLLFLIIALMLFTADIVLRRFGIEIHIIRVFKRMSDEAKAKAAAMNAKKQTNAKANETKAENTAAAEAAKPSLNEKKNKESRHREKPANQGIDTEFLFKKQNERRR